MSGSKDKKQRKSGFERVNAKDREAELARQKQTRTAVILLIVIAVLALVVFVLNSAFFYRNVTALNVDGHRLSITDMNFYASATSYDAAVENARRATLLNRRAVAEGLTLDDEARAELEETMSFFSESFSEWNFPSANSFVTAHYGRGMNMRMLRERLEFDLLGRMYTDLFLERLHNSWTEADLEAYYMENREEYDRVSFRVYEIQFLSDELLEEMEDGSGGITREEAMAMAENILAITDGTTNVAAPPYVTEPADIDADEDLEEADEAELDEPADTADATPTDTDGAEARFLQAVEAYLGPDADLATRRDGALAQVEHLPYANWLLDGSRELGDTTIITDDEFIYVLLFIAQEDNNYYTANVRHILIRPEHIPVEDADGALAAEARVVALAQAEELLAQWRAGGATEEYFIELVREYSEDYREEPDPGLFEGVNRQTGFVPEFLNWTMDESRRVGDVEIVETDHGFHIMFFAGHNTDLTHRLAMAQRDKGNALFTDWLTEALEGVSANSTFFSRLVTSQETPGW